MEGRSTCRCMNMEKARPFIGVVFLQVGLAGMDILSKAALNKGMSNYVLVVYRHAIATIVMAPFAFFLDRKVRPKMTLAIFTRMMLLGLLEPVIDQNLYYLGMKYTTATFAAAMYNVLPAMTFVLACIFRLERVKLRCIRSIAKIGGTVATVAGAMIMTLVKGPDLGLSWTKGTSANHISTGGIDIQSSIKGAALITIGCFGYACFMILQATTLRIYPADLSLTVWICLLGTVEGAVVALVMEGGKSSAWSIGWDTQLFTAVYSGIMCSGLGYYIGGNIMKDRGPVFVTAFNPLCMVIVAVMSTLIFSELMYLGRVLGAIVICAGLYFVIWGKSKDYERSSPVIKNESANLDKQMVDFEHEHENEIAAKTEQHQGERDLEIV